MQDNMRFVLLILEGRGKGLAFELDGQTIYIGTAADISIEGENIAPKHAVLRIRGYNYEVSRVQRTYPVYVNDRLVESEVLSSMDEITIGNVKMLYTVSQLTNLDDDTDILDRRKPNHTFDVHQTNDGKAHDGAVAAHSRKEFNTRKMGDNDAGLPTILEQADTPFRIQTRLKFTKGVMQGKVCEFMLPRIIIGRTIGDLIISDPDISRKHCSIQFQSRRRIFLHDHASTNGTYLNGNRISYSLLRTGDVITMGSSECQVAFRTVAKE